MRGWESSHFLCFGSYAQKIARPLKSNHLKWRKGSLKLKFFLTFSTKCGHFPARSYLLFRSWETSRVKKVFELSVVVFWFCLTCVISTNCCVYQFCTELLSVCIDFSLTFCLCRQQTCSLKLNLFSLFFQRQIRQKGVSMSLNFSLSVFCVFSFHCVNCRGLPCIVACSP